MNRLYTLCGMVAGTMILAMCGLIVAQIVARPFGLIVPGADELAIGAFVGAVFLGLPYTLWTKGHVRADVVVQLLRPRWRRRIEIAVHLVAIAFVGFFIYFAADLAWSSYLRTARFQGLLGSPLWVPQSMMVLGLVLFEAALVHGLARILVGRAEGPDGGVEPARERA